MHEKLIFLYDEATIKNKRFELINANTQAIDYFKLISAVAVFQYTPKFNVNRLLIDDMHVVIILDSDIVFMAYTTIIASF